MGQGPADRSGVMTRRLWELYRFGGNLPLPDLLVPRATRN